jgi:hypothetical protein
MMRGLFARLEKLGRKRRCRCEDEEAPVHYIAAPGEIIAEAPPCCPYCGRWNVLEVEEVVAPRAAVLLGQLTYPVKENI